MRAFWDNPKARAGLCIVVPMMLCAAWAQLFLDVSSAGDAVAAPLLSPSASYWFGTTIQGQDVFMQTLAGAGPTIFYALITGIGVTVLSVGIGVCAGFFGGWTDHGLSLLINVFLLIPGLPLMIVLAAMLPAGPLSITLVLIFTGWPWGARVLRGPASASARSAPWARASPRARPGRGRAGSRAAAGGRR